ncbi:DUF1330 domain-containing protein [Enterovibrio norvegicus]|uniref:DUF1330 domain-containing protein n=1 Tax=Enterovibrio norvegicus TaxID=188144 RepID=A0A2N7L3U2_9GAMM|nr:DUF1330 domain-containing protein [Enterovibrio norvegicus]PML77066.1 DUF1330 domain-containing protein [Enterovibrio norvegicus]PMN88044.1 DUF1330 domain-containing protein [Enterovibrio norvegicus]
MNVTNALYPTDAQMLALHEAHDNKPIQLLNLFKFKAKAEYADGRPCTLSGKAAYDLYGQPMLDVLTRYGAEVVYFAEVTGLIIGDVDTLWDAMVIVKYPSRQALIDMTSCDDFNALRVHREAGLEGQLNIEMQVPE